MNTETANSLTDILTNISELQTTLLAVPEAGDAIDSLCAMRKAALTAMRNLRRTDTIAGAHRQECLDQVDNITSLLAAKEHGPLPDSTLFRIGAAADSLARQVSLYAAHRNHAAAARIILQRTEAE